MIPIVSSNSEKRSSRSLFLIYHELGPGMEPYSYYCNTKSFEEHLRLIHKIQLSAQERTRIPVVTFDDGHISQYAHALPLLQQYGIRAIFFITTGWINSRANYMRWPDIRELHSLGHQVQSHTCSHPMLTHCASSELEKELTESRQMIEDHVGAPADAISIPNGRWNGHIAEACATAGYRRIFTSDSWRDEKLRHGARILGRMNVPQSMTADTLELLAGNAWQQFLHHSRSYAKHLLRNAMGDALYHRLWRIASHARDAE